MYDNAKSIHIHKQDPLKQGLKLKHWLSAISQYITIHKQDPLKQGLKLYWCHLGYLRASYS